MVHFDLCVPMNIRDRGGFKYFNIFIDDYSRHGYIYLIHRKSECFEKVKGHRPETGNFLDKCIKTLRSHRGGEYLLEEFRN
jgi:hypothetical protein